VTSPAEAERFIRFQLEQLAVCNEHHTFENHLRPRRQAAGQQQHPAKPAPEPFAWFRRQSHGGPSKVIADAVRTDYLHHLAERRLLRELPTAACIRT